MKKSSLILALLSISFFLMAQEPVKQKEIGLVFSNLDNFGLTFKTGTDKSLWRFNTLLISGINEVRTSDSLVDNYNRLGFGIELGKEYRKEIGEKLELRFGADVSFTYSQSKSDSDDKSVDNDDWLDEETTYRPGVNLVFGLNYVINKNFVIGAELLPYFSYTFGTTVREHYYLNDGNEVKRDISGFSYGLSNSSVLLSLAYRF